MREKQRERLANHGKLVDSRLDPDLTFGDRPLIFEFVTKLLSNATSFHHILLDRAVAGMLRLAALIAKYADMRDQVFVALDTLHTLPAAMLQGMSDQIATGLARILPENPDIAGSMTEWNLIFGLWSATASKEASAAVTFELITQLSSGSLGQGLNSENFVGFVRVLNDFATIAGHGDLQYRNSPDGANDPVVLRGKHSLSMIRDAQSMANALIKQSSLNAAAGECFGSRYVTLLNLPQHGKRIGFQYFPCTRNKA